jgi:hypothetical protein
VSAVRRELAKLRELLALAGDVQTELQRHFERLEHKIRDRCCEHRCGSEPAHITLTASTSPEGPPVSSYPEGVPVYLTAAVANAEQVAITDDVSWSASAGTVTADPANPLWATLVNAPVGDATVTATTSNGIEATDTVTIVDNTPASISLSDSATPNTPAA